MQGDNNTTEETISSATAADQSATDTVSGVVDRDPAASTTDADSAAESSAPRRRRRAASRAAGPPVADVAGEPAAEGEQVASDTEAGDASVAASESAGASGAAKSAVVLFQAPAFEAPLPKQDFADDEAPATTTSRTDDARGGGSAIGGEGRASASRDSSDQTSASGRDDPDDADADDDDDDDDDNGPRRRRRRRGGRGRRKKVDATSSDSGDGDNESATVQSDVSAKSDDAGDNDADDNADDSDEGAGTRRRRRRKRRGDSEDRRADDPPNTVVKVRDHRESDDEVTSVKGSTRLEAKKQRRREGREAGRRKAPILSEAEFLARREAVDRVMAVRQENDLTQIGVLEDGVLVEHYVSRASQTSLIGNVYLGRVQNVLPAMEAAFVDIGRGRNAVIYAGEVDWSEHDQGSGERRIEDVLKSGQTVLVQVTKDPVGHKGARLTSQISLPGRYVVYVPGGSMSGISRKLPDTERTRLKKILKQVVPDDAGVIVRTAAEGASEEELTNDVARLRDQWEAIKKKSSGNAPALLQAEPDMAIKVVRDLFNEDFTKLVVSGGNAWDTINEYIGTVAGSLHDRLEKWTPPNGNSDIFDAYRVNEQIAKALDRKVWLPSGGSLIIDRTEAMTVIDVNTGKFTGSGGNLEETVTKNNLEAAEEIVRQLRLRDIGGIIVIDFIDMVLEANRDLVLRRLVECLGRDRTKHQVAEVTSLGLVQMTRKRIGTGLLEAFGEPCTHCRGRGMILHDHPVEPSGGDTGSGDGSSGRSGRRGRRRSASSEPSAQPENEDHNHKPKIEASADPGHASPADLILVPEDDSATPE